VKPNRLSPYIILSIFFHCALAVLLFQYGVPTQEKPDKTIAVETLSIRERPVVSIHSPGPHAEPQAFRSRSTPMVVEYDSTLGLSDPEMVEEPIVPHVEIPGKLSASTLKEVREAIVAPIQRVRRAGKTPVVTTTAINALSPEDDPQIDIKQMKGQILLAASTQDIPLSEKGGMTPSTIRKIKIPATGQGRESFAPPPPRVLVPNDEPVVLPLDSLPAIPLPGSPQGASFVLAIDTSGSVKGAPMDGIKASAVEFISLMGPKDRVRLMTFDDNPRLITPVTSKKEVLTHMINGLQTAGKLTVLNEALLMAGLILRADSGEHVHIVLFSDGKDEGSRATLDQVIDRLRKQNVSVLTVGYTKVEKKYLDILRRIADETGGVYVQRPEFQDILALYKKASPEPEGIPEITESIGAILVKSDPNEAQIYIDGEYMGITPMLIKLPMGKYQLVLQRDGYYEWKAQLELTEPVEIPLFAKLSPI
jgi:hypothetical protein